MKFQTKQKNAQKNQKVYEVNFDGIVGPTHNYGGLAYGNIASKLNAQLPSNPREAAIQGLNKMKFMADLGLKQAVLPPHERPHLPTLRALGFDGNTEELLTKVYKTQPQILSASASSAAMWTANAATVTPSSDSFDKLVHFTPANLTSKFHRAIEAQDTAKILRTIFKDEQYFKHHTPLPVGSFFADEGAANHCRLCKTYDSPAIHLFVHGRYGFETATTILPKIFPARQTFEASQSIVRLHQLNPTHAVYAQQNPLAIDSGVFHNDVISTNNENLFFYHEEAFLNQKSVIDEIAEKMQAICKSPLCQIEVKKSDISLSDAVNSYLFNSQIVTLSSGKMALIAPIECQQNPQIAQYLEKILQHAATPLAQVHFIDLRQSMQNGGGPACLRLRVVLNQHEFAAMHPHVILDSMLYQSLITWVNRHYRDQLYPKDLADPQLLNEVHQALDELTKILHLGNLYSFQMQG